MSKNRLFLLGACVVAATTGVATAGPSHPCDDRIWYYPRSGGVVRTSTVVVASSPSVGSVVTVPPSSGIVIQRGWVTGTGESGPMWISTPGVTTITAPAPGYAPAWADAPASNVVAVPPASTVVVVPDNAVVVQSPTVVQPLSAHDRLVVLNQFSSPSSSDRTILYRDATGLLHERTVFGGGGIFYDHLGRRCRYDHDRSTIVILDDRVVRDYNRNGVCDDDRYRDPHRAAELRYYDSTLYRGVRPLERPGNAWSPAFRADVRRPGIGRDDRDDRRYEAPRVDDRRYSPPSRPAGGAVNGRLIDDSRRTGNDRKGSPGTSRPKR